MRGSIGKSVAYVNAFTLSHSEVSLVLIAFLLALLATFTGSTHASHPGSTMSVHAQFKVSAPTPNPNSAHALAG